MKNPLPGTCCMIVMIGTSALPSCQAPQPAEEVQALSWLMEQGVSVAPDLLATEELKFYATPTPEQLSSLVLLPQLQTLTIWDEGEWNGPTYPVGRLDDASLRRICALPQIRTLVVAGWNSFVTDRGLEYLLELEHLEVLNLCMTSGITDEGMSTLARLPELRILGLTYTDITDLGMANLLPAPQLRQVDYGWTPRHEEYLQRFRSEHSDAGFLIRFH